MKVPAGACDTHMHFYDTKVPGAPATFLPGDFTVEDYRKMQKRLGLERVIVVQPNAYADDNEVTVSSIKKLGKNAKGVAVVKPDVKDAELGHHGKECSFEAILKRYNLTTNPALVLLGKIVNGADTDNTLYAQPEGPGLEAIAEGFRYLGYKDDHALNGAEWIVYDALYAYCQEMVRQGKLSGAFKA